MILSNRLQAIADFVQTNSIVGDIGTDHGYIPAYLIEKKIAKKVIATDLSKGSIEKIEQFINKIKLRDNIDIRLGNGLEVLKPFEIDTIIISGMGGLLIKDILDKDRMKRDTITNFILQPNIAVKELRKYLYENSFEILDERLAKDGNKIYEIIYAIKGKAYLEHPIHYEIGIKLVQNNDPLLAEHIKNKIRVIEKILNALELKETQKSQERGVELHTKIKELREVLEKVESNGSN